VTLEALNVKSIAYPCADRLVFRDFQNDLTILDVNAVQMKVTGNFTNTKEKGYICHPQWEQVGQTPLPVRVLSSTSSMVAALRVNAQRSTSFYFKSNVPLFKGRYDFIHPQYICGAVRPNISVSGDVNIPQYLEDDGLYGPLICAWDFVFNREQRKPPINETSVFNLKIEISSVLNLTRVSKRSQCGDGNYLQIVAPGNEIPLLLICSKSEMKMKEGLYDEDTQLMKDDAGVVAEALYNPKKKSGLSMTVPLVLSKLPFQKAVVMVKLNNLKTSYGVKISWRGIQ